MKRQLIRLSGMLIIGLSVALMTEDAIGPLVFIIIWVAGFLIYDQHQNY